MKNRLKELHEMKKVLIEQGANEQLLEILLKRTSEIAMEIAIEASSAALKEKIAGVVKEIKKQAKSGSDT